jgi:hypothetical protein
VFENRVLRRTFGLKRHETVGDWRKFRNEKVYNLYSAPNVIRMITSTKIRWAGHVAHMGEKRNPYRFLM